jgi:hypothetical protein
MDTELDKNINTVLEDMDSVNPNIDPIRPVEGPLTDQEISVAMQEATPPDLTQDIEEYEVAMSPKKILGGGKKPKPDPDPVLPEDAIDTNTVKSELDGLAESYDKIKVDDLKDELGIVQQSADGKLTFKGFTLKEQDELIKNFELLYKGELDQLPGGINNMLRNSQGELFDFATISDLAGMYANKSSSITLEELEQAASNIGRNDLYKAIRDVTKGKAQNLNKEYAVRTAFETMLLDIYSNHLGNMIMKGNTDAVVKDNFFKSFAQSMVLRNVIKEPISDGATLMRYTQGDNQLVKNLNLQNLERQQDIMNYFKDNKISFKTLAFMMNDLNPAQREHFRSNFYDKVVAKIHDYGKKIATGAKQGRHVLIELYINSKLSSPLTHISNIAGNTLWNGWRILEYSLAAGYNKALGITDADALQFNQIMEMMYGFNDGLKLGSKNAKLAFTSGNPIDGLDKVDLGQTHTISRDKLGNYKDTPLGDLVEGLGFASRLPTNLLTAEDEFFKGVLYTMELRKIARGKYNQARKKGLTHEEATEVFETTLADPGPHIKEEAMNLAREGTFTGNLPALGGDIQKFFNIPEVKAFVPFYKTVMNIFFEASARVPFVHLLNPTTRKQLSGELGPQARRLALTKLSMGTAFITGWGMLSYGKRGPGDDWFITGGPPQESTARKKFFEAGFRPYSIIVRQEDGSYKSYEYKRFDPFGQMMGLAADMTYLFTRPDVDSESKEVLELAMLTLNAMGAMVTDNPLVDGANILGDFVDFQAADMDAWARKNIGSVMKTGTEYLYGTWANPFSAFQNTRSQVTEPVQKDYDLRIIDGEIHSWEDFYDLENMSPILQEALGEVYKSASKIQDQSFFWNTDSPPALTFWGEEMKGPEQKWYSWTRVYGSEWNAIDKAMLKYGLYLEMPERKIGGVQLSAKEYRDFILEMNNVTVDFADLGRNLTLKMAMRRLVTSDKWIAKASSDDPKQVALAHEDMKSVYREYKLLAVADYKRNKEGYSVLSEEAKYKKYEPGERVTFDIEQ